MTPNIRPGHRNLRKGRVSLVGQKYLITTVTAKRLPLFADFTTALGACRALHEAQFRTALDILCWVLMPDHLHAIVELVEGNISQAVGDLKARLATAVNRARRRSEPVWVRAFHDRALRRDDNVFAVARYVIANPVRAGLVQSVRQYPFWDAVWLQP